MPSLDDTKIHGLVSRYQQSIFSLVMYLIGGDKNTAYDVTVQAFVQAFQATPFLQKEDAFLIKLTAAAIHQSQVTEAMPANDDADFVLLPPEKIKVLQVTKKALSLLPFNSKVFLLLRDQLHFPYHLTSVILRTPEKVVRIETSQSRQELREKIEEVLRRGQ